MIRVIAILAASACVCVAQEYTTPVYQTDFSTASVAKANAPIDGGGELQSGFSVSEYSAGLGMIRMLLVPRGEEVDSKVDPASWGELAFISERAGTNLATNSEDAVEVDAYIEFTLHSEEPVDFTRIEFAMVGYGSAKTGGVTLRSSADNFASDLGIVEGKLDNNVYPTSVDLVEAGFTNVSEMTFRFYLYDTFEGPNNRLIGIDDVRVWAAPTKAAASQ